MDESPAPVAFDDLVAIDVHTHVLRSVAGSGQPAPFEDSLRELFGFDELPDLRQMARDYRRRRMAFVVFDVDDFATSGRRQTVSNEEIARVALEYPDVVVPFGSVDPHRGDEAVAIARRLVEQHHVRGFKFHPTQQQFFPDDRQYYPLYETLEGLGATALFHSGITGVGRGQPGGSGMRLKFSNPMRLDDLAVDFPRLRIIIAHPSFPWQDEALAVAQHKPNVYIDLSGWSPKYFPESLVANINGPLRDKVLFGSDFPALTPERWLADFATLPVKEQILPMVLRDNAVRALSWPGGLSTGQG
ncbi:amidohydrolase family protein [Amycolatopsis sp. GA6-003]|uniref:amidohydrolase family protein n=1 Tax=Amycolatopsis sp. GA6-003 TaxID=2652444 RepID=UPI003916F51B